MLTAGSEKEENTHLISVTHTLQITHFRYFLYFFFPQLCVEMMASRALKLSYQSILQSTVQSSDRHSLIAETYKYLPFS